MNAPIQVNEKRLATLAARAALHGITLKLIEGDFVKNLFVLTKWQLTLQLASMDQVEHYLDHLQGPRRYG